MNGFDVLQEARRRGLSVTPEGGNLRIRPGRLCPPDFAALLRAYKSELLTLLANGNPAGPSRVVKPYRPLSERERQLLIAFCGNENDPVIIEALNLFNGRIVG